MTKEEINKIESIHNLLRKLSDKISKFYISLPIRYIVNIKTKEVVETQYRYGNKWMTASEIEELRLEQYEAINKLQTIFDKFEQTTSNEKETLGVKYEKEN